MSDEYDEEGQDTVDGTGVYHDVDGKPMEHFEPAPPPVWTGSLFGTTSENDEFYESGGMPPHAPKASPMQTQWNDDTPKGWIAFEGRNPEGKRKGSVWGTVLVTGAGILLVIAAYRSILEFVGRMFMH